MEFISIITNLARANVLHVFGVDDAEQNRALGGDYFIRVQVGHFSLAPKWGAKVFPNQKTAI